MCEGSRSVYPCTCLSALHPFLFIHSHLYFGESLVIFVNVVAETRGRPGLSVTEMEPVLPIKHCVSRTPPPPFLGVTWPPYSKPCWPAWTSCDPGYSVLERLS